MTILFELIIIQLFPIAIFELCRTVAKRYKLENLSKTVSCTCLEEIRISDTPNGFLDRTFMDFYVQTG